MTDEETIRRVPDCHPEREHEARGLCSSCYVRARMARIAEAEGRVPHKSGHPGSKRRPDCHPDRKHFAKGMCRPCWRAEWRKGRNDQPSPSSKFRYHLTRYGLTPEDYAEMVDEQGGACAICGQSVQLVVDHDHSTGVVRGLLCRLCNAGIGMLRDDPVLVAKAFNYLTAESAA